MARNVRDVLNPVFVISPPRAGSTLLFNLISSMPAFWSLYRESHAVLDASFESLRTQGILHSDILGANEADLPAAAVFKKRFLSGLMNYEGSFEQGLRLFPNSSRFRLTPQKLVLRVLSQGTKLREAGILRFVEKTARNSLRIDFLVKLFPNARFIFLHRGSRDIARSMYDGWLYRKGRKLPNKGLSLNDGTSLKNWCFLQPLGWDSTRYDCLGDVVSFQIEAAYRCGIESLNKVPPSQVLCVKLAELSNSPVSEFRRISNFINAEPDNRLIQILEALPAVNPTPPSLGGKTTDELQPYVQRLEDLDWEVTEWMERKGR